MTLLDLVYVSSVFFLLVWVRSLLRKQIYVKRNFETHKLSAHEHQQHSQQTNQID